MSKTSNYFKAFWPWGMVGHWDSLSQVPELLIGLAMRNLESFFLPIANSSTEIASKKTYAEMYLTIMAKSKPTKEAQFHAKNMANTLESKVKGSWKDAAESEKNGLGPGFRAMCHVIKGLGKDATALSTEEMEMALEESTKSIQAVWPWKISKVRRRHTQALYCECQKALGMARKGNVQGNIVRSCTKITTETLQKINMRETYHQAALKVLKVRKSDQV